MSLPMSNLGRTHTEKPFLGLQSELASVDPRLEDLAYTLIISICFLRANHLVLSRFTMFRTAASCAVGRADIVGKFFDDLTAKRRGIRFDYILSQPRQSPMKTCVKTYVGKYTAELGTQVFSH